jgi:hypothetical protein
MHCLQNFDPVIAPCPNHLWQVGGKGWLGERHDEDREVDRMKKLKFKKN